MIHAREDYNRIQDPAVNDPSLLSPGSTPIGADEPVMLFRAQDWFAPDVLTYYADRIERQVKPDFIKLVLRQANRMREWQREHGKKVPDCPA